ncbi:secretory carrier-associated membrane protein 3-like [Notothenia coriiceps]|uniref:Secretory carrier-associated membrane protein n=1 Tax=Notothenia coriiceps TaxID=8208 RepID=A0A6I9MWD0_9TELE|nr:PREDICTED: secretory carrier-associated membrane protein 3-like [Notothenia coriiceps]
MSGFVGVLDLCSLKSTALSRSNKEIPPVHSAILIYPSVSFFCFFLHGPVGTCTLLFNLVSSLAMFCVDPSGGVGLGLAILWALLFTPCSFVCWYRPMYKAFRSDSSFNFFVFFFIFFAQVVTNVIMTIGIPGWGFSGWIVSLAALKTSVPVGAIMMLNAVCFTAQTAMGVVMLQKIHSQYRQTDASFQKAQAEFATGVMSNQAVRQAATTAATSAAQGAFNAPR